MEEMTDQQMDEIIAQSEAPAAEIPMETAAPVEDTPSPEQTQAEAAQLRELQVNGRTLKVNDNQLTQWAQQGMDYAQKMEALKNERTEWESKIQAFEPYKQIDEYAKANPEWWELVQNAYSAKDQQEALDQASTENPENQVLQGEIAKLQETLNEQSEFINNLKNEREQAKISKEDETLNSEISAIRDKHPDLAWDVVDENGQTLEQRVIDHAVANNIGDFEAAFLKLNYENLIGLEREKAKEGISKTIQTSTKLGLLGQKPAPTSDFRPPSKGQSWNDLLAEASAELSQINGN